MATASGELLGNRFKLLSERNAFPFGAWWEAEDDQGARTLVFRLHAQVSDPAAAVANAIDSARKIDSPHVVAWVDGGVDAAGHGWLAAPMLGPWSFAEHIGRTEGIEPAEAAPLVHQVARGMAAAEKAGVVHHALSSDFLRVVPLPDGSNSIRIYGYGLADVLPPYKPLRKQDAYVGVPDYMAPELCGGKAVDGMSADIYAIGILMYEAVRGKPPFAPTFASASASTTLKRHIFEKPLPLHVRYATTRFIKPYEAISFKALNKASNRRQATLAELEAELEGLVTGEMQLPIVSLEAVGARPPQTARRSRTQIIESQGGNVNVAVATAAAEPAKAAAPEPEKVAASAPAKAEPAPSQKSEPAPQPKDEPAPASAASAPEPEAASEPEAAADEVAGGVIVDDASIVVDGDLDEEGHGDEPVRATVRTQMFTGLAAQADAIAGDDDGDDGSEESSAPDDNDTKERDGGGRGGKGKKGRHKTRKSRRPSISSQAAAGAAPSAAPASGPSAGGTAESESPDRKRAAAAPTVVMAAAKSQVDTKDEGAASASSGSETDAVARPKVSSKLADKDADKQADKHAGKHKDAGDKDVKAVGAGLPDEQDAWFDAGADDVAVPKKRSLVPLLLLALLAVVVVVVVVMMSSSGPPEPVAPAAPEGPRYGLKTSTPTTPAEPVKPAPTPEPVAVEPTPAAVEPTPAPAEPAPVAAEPTPPPEPTPAPEPAAAEPAGEPVAVEPPPEPKPVVAEPKPEPKPVVAEPKPEPKPVVAEPKPEPKPVVAEPKPEPKPVVAEPKPEPKPVVAEPKPAPKPTATAPKPATNSPEDQFKEDAKRFMELGTAAYKKENYKLAVGYFKRALEKDPSHALAARYLKQAEAKLAE